MYEIHEVAKIFPALTGSDLDALTADIKAHGQLEPIITFGGKVIDGRNRLAACIALGKEPWTREWAGEEKDLLAFVLSLNLHRRHLTDDQRAAIAARLSHSGTVSIREAAKSLKVTKSRVQRASQVYRSGTDTAFYSSGADVAEEIEAGRMSLAKAEAVTKVRREMESGAEIPHLDDPFDDWQDWMPTAEFVSHLGSDFSKLEVSRSAKLAHVKDFIDHMGYGQGAS